MPKGPESKIERALKAYMESKGGLFPKSVSPGNKGWPDRNPIHPVSGPFYMEIKRSSDVKASPLQVEIAQEIANAGGRVYLDVGSELKGKQIIDDEVNGVPPSDRRHQPVSLDKEKQ